MMELYNILSVTTTLYITYNYALATDQTTHDWTIPGVLLMELFLLWHCSRNAKQPLRGTLHYRPATSSGIFLTTVLPLTHLGEHIAGYLQTGGDMALIQFWLSLGSVSAAIARWLWVSNDRGIAPWSLLIVSSGTLVASVVAASYAAYVTSCHLSLWRFVFTYALFATAALGFLHVTLPETPLLWLYHFTMDGCQRVFLVVTWFLLLAISLIWTANQSLQLKQTGSSRKEVKSHQGDAFSPTNVSAKFTARKMFHVFIVLVFIPGLLADPQFLFLATTVVFGVFVVVEAARSWEVPVIGPYINDTQKMFVDERDQGGIFLTHFYLLLGMSLPLWMSPLLFSSSKASPEMYAGVLGLGVGDTVACLCGRAFGSLRWPGSKKTIEGTVCSVLSQIALVTAGSMAGVVTITRMSTVLIGVTLAALAEAFTDQIDNLLLPLVLYPVLCFS
ncbi:dolichol kinase [Elysia marginata]|uniref:dolichol kinase n=1 Tax=Elysia marginata TaxID=1093978 RepID=A0AAV4JIS2_9GAST|nr:dolichol kinase [Elysia marginata]